jgi:hypothetical protein
MIGGNIAITLIDPVVRPSMPQAAGDPDLAIGAKKC